MGFKVSAPFPDGELDGIPEVVTFDELMSTPVTRVTLRDPSATSEETSSARHASACTGSSTPSAGARGSTSPEGVSKGAALEVIRRWLAIEPCTPSLSETSATTSRCCAGACGVAMGNALDEVKAVADEVTVTPTTTVSSSLTSLFDLTAPGAATSASSRAS